MLLSGAEFETTWIWCNGLMILSRPSISSLESEPDYAFSNCGCMHTRKTASMFVIGTRETLIDKWIINKEIFRLQRHRFGNYTAEIQTKRDFFLSKLWKKENQRLDVAESCKKHDTSYDWIEEKRIWKKQRRYTTMAQEGHTTTKIYSLLIFFPAIIQYLHYLRKSLSIVQTIFSCILSGIYAQLFWMSVWLSLIITIFGRSIAAAAAKRWTKACECAHFLLARIRCVHLTEKWAQFNFWIIIQLVINHFVCSSVVCAILPKWASAGWIAGSGDGSRANKSWRAGRMLDAWYRTEWAGWRRDVAIWNVHGMAWVRSTWYFKFDMMISFSGWFDCYSSMHIHFNQLHWTHKI